MWQEGQNVAGTIKVLNFSVRYTADFKPVKDGAITFEMDTDDCITAILVVLQVYAIPVKYSAL